MNTSVYYFVTHNCVPHELLHEALRLFQRHQLGSELFYTYDLVIQKNAQILFIGLSIGNISSIL